MGDVGERVAIAGVTAPRGQELSPGDVLGARYRIRRRLGEGGMGVVYEASDDGRKTAVALKTLTRVDANGVYRLKSEFRSLADVVHPNLVRLHELHAEDGRWFFTMGLVHGRPFIEHVRRAGSLGYDATIEAIGPEAGELTARPVASGTFHEATLRACLADLVTGVDAIHRAGKLHRDLKPSNILVTDEGRVVILDFGLASDSRDLEDAPGRTLAEEGVSGTPGYMAPEQCRAEITTEASDWYAVGVVLFEALTGRLPFEGTTMQVLLAKQTNGAPSPRQLVEDVPADLNELCVQLLERDPRARPSGAEIQARLGAVSSRPSLDDALVSPFVGRARELEQLDELARLAEDGRSVVGVITGPSGIGKSAILEQFLKRMRASGAIVLGSRCYEREAVPFKAFDGVVDALTRHLRRLDPVETAALLPRNVGALCRLFPVLSRVDIIARMPQRVTLPTDAHELRRVGFAALKELILRICDRRRLVLAVDDLQWADRDSYHLFESVFGAEDSAPTLVLGTCRSVDEERGPFLGQLLDARRALPRVTVRTISVEPLDDADVEAMIRGLSPRATLDAARLREESRGNPFFIEELVRHARDDGATLSFADLLRARLGALPEDARRLLELIAVAARPLRIATAASVCGVEVAALGVAFDALSAAGLARSLASGDQGVTLMGIHHERVREAVVATLSEDSLRGWHARIARALEGLADEDPETLSHHALAADDAERASRYALEGARRARENLAFERAASLYRRAIDHGAHAPDAHLALLVQLAETLVLAGRDADAGQVYLEASQIAVGPEHASLVRECRRRAAEQLILSGDLAQGTQVLSRVLADIGVSLPHSTGRSLLALLWDRLVLSLRGLAWKPRDESTVDPKDLARLEAYNVVAASLALVHPIVGLQFQARLLRLALRVGVARYVVVAFGMYGLTLALGGLRGFRKGKPLLAEAHATAAMLPPEHRARYAGLASGTEGVATLCVGRYADARAKLSESVESFEGRAVDHTGEQVARNNIRLLHLATLIAAGEVAEASRRFDDLLRDAKRRGDHHLEASATRLLNNVWLFRDKPAEARRALAALTWKPLHEGFDLQRVYELRAEIGIDLYEDGEGLLANKYRDAFAAFDRSLIRTVEIEKLLFAWGRARVFLHDAERGAKGAVQRAAGWSRVLLRAHPSYARIYGSLVAAAVAHQRGDDHAARACLRDAIRSAEESGHNFEIAAARHHLGRLSAGEEGQRLVVLAREWAEREGIVRPEALFRSVAPGLGPRRS